MDDPPVLVQHGLRLRLGVPDADEGGSGGGGGPDRLWEVVWVEPVLGASQRVGATPVEGRHGRAEREGAGRGKAAIGGPGVHLRAHRHRRTGAAPTALLGLDAGARVVAGTDTPLC